MTYEVYALGLVYKIYPLNILDAFLVYFSESGTTVKARKATKGDKIIAAVSFTPSIDLTVIQGIIYLIWLVPGDLDLTWYIRTGRVSSSRACPGILTIRCNPLV